MPTPKNLLVPLDFSPQSDAALATAHELAAQSGATVHLLHVFTLQDKRERDLLGNDPRAYEQSRLDAAADKLRASGRLGDVLFVEGDPASEVVNTARKHGCDLIVIGASGRTGLQRMLLGSVAESVTRDAPCTVMVVRSPQGAE